MSSEAPLCLSDTRALLDRLGLRPSRHRGQNFLVDGNIVRKSLELAEIRRGDLVVEIGPGLGTLTRALLAAGCRVHAVELDRGLYAYLREEVVPVSDGRLHLIEGDALDFPRAGLGELSQGGYKVVANLPYAISTPWMDAILSGPLPSRMVLMLQKEAAQRYTAVHGSKNFGAISIALQSVFDVAPGHRVAASCFFPRPDIDSMLLNLRLKAEPKPLSPAFRQALRGWFGHRRKQLLPLIRDSHPHAASAAAAWLQAAGLSPSVRAEEIPLENWLDCGSLQQAVEAAA
jgi:16S rRNA (adenine1518-N6/adenine1519-N6)-dimethyltransferase